MLRMTKLSFVIGEFISGWSHEAWMKIMPCGSLRNERANDIEVVIHTSTNLQKKKKSNKGEQEDE